MAFTGEEDNEDGLDEVLATPVEEDDLAEEEATRVESDDEDL